MQDELFRRGRFESPFFRSKFRVPAAPRHFVRRERLLELLDDLAAYPVTAVVAPAGAGKTILAADWIRHCGRRSAWLALDESDRDADQFCAAVISAVDSLAPGIADRARSVMSGPSGPVGALRAITDHLELTDGDDAVLVIDNLHHVDDSLLARSSLATFVEHLPDWLHLLLLSRRRPAVPVDRLRAAGQFADIGFDALRLTDPEDQEMLAGLCPDAGPRELSALAAWSGGWAAALQLAALAVRSKRPAHVVDAGTVPLGSDRLVDSYLWHEVLGAERDELVDLLVSTAVVERMNYGLAEALTRRSDAGDLLAEAEERGLFVTRFDAGGWFEVHGLVREVLLAELERRSPVRLREQHARAARWLEDMGEGMGAIEHWLDADRPAEALRLLAAISMTGFDTGCDGTLDRIMDRIPPEVGGATTASLVQLAWCRLLIDRAGFLSALAAVEESVAEQGDDHQDDGSISLLRSVAGWLTGDWQACIEHAGAGVERLGHPGPADPLGRFGRTLTAHGLALDERWSDDGAALRVGPADIADHGGELPLQGGRAVGLAVAGFPVDALRAAAGSGRLAQGVGRGILRTELDIAEAIAARELGDRERSAPALESLSTHPSFPCSYVQGLALLEVVEMRLREGGDAGGPLAQLEEVVRRDVTGPGGRGWLARAGVQVALDGGNVAAAEQWSRQTDDAFWRPIGEARVQLATDRNHDALEAAARAEPRCPRHDVVKGLLLGRSLRRVDHEAAAKSVASAVELAAEHGMLETVAANGGPVLELVELAAWRVPDAWMDRLRRILAPDLAHRQLTPGPVEELTSRERDVMRLLPSRLTLREIASELFVSQNTLKFHLRVIYRKLGVNSRAEAVETARRLRLLARR